jgi:hypothetical protein
VTQIRSEIAATARRLDALSVADLSDADIDADTLLEILRSETAALRVRLFACEILLRRDTDAFLTLAGTSLAAALYAAALRQGTAGELNPWGFLGMGDIGPFGKHLIACGVPAVAALAPLLDIAQPAGVYSGSKEAALGDSDKARICDFAAFFIATILGSRYTFHRRDIAARDAEIARLKEAVARRRLGATDAKTLRDRTE